MEIRFSSGILLIVNIMLGLGFLGFRILVIVLEFIVPDEFFTVYKLGLKIKEPRHTTNRLKRLDRSFRYKVVSIRTQAVKLHMISTTSSSLYSLRVNNKNILGEYSSFFTPRT